jgi:hypothetical protein
VTFSRNVVAECFGSTALSLSSGTIVNDCNVFWMNPNGDLDGISYGSQDRIIDPAFCSPDSGDLTVSDGSPCLPAYSSGCGQIGAEGAGCGTVSIRPESWGSIKGKYHGGVREGD